MEIAEGARYTAGMATLDFSRLSPQEKLDLIGELWDSLDPDTVPVSAEWTAELDRRNARFAEDRGQAIPWASVKAKLRP